MAAMNTTAADEPHRPSMLEVKEIDASIHPCCWILSIPIHCCLCPYRTIVRLESDQLIRIDNGLCGKSNSYRPYSSVGTVQSSSCLCINCVDSNVGPLIAGWGCDEEWAEATALELKARGDAFSDRRHIQLTEEVAFRTKMVFDKMEAIERYLEMQPQNITMTDR